MKWSLNTSRFSLTSLSLAVGSGAVIGTQLCKIGEELGGELVYGSSPFPLGRVIGQLKGTAQIELVPEEADELFSRLGPGFGEVPVGLSASLVEVYGSGVYNVSCDTCWITKPDMDIAKELAKVTLDLMLASMVNWNGNTILDLAARGGTVNGVGGLAGASGLTFSL
jgi:hypothetical protein